MKVGAPFNPYRVFQGSFAPYWLLEHRGISAGAKLCYIRLLGFAGKDARCYPSLQKLGASLGVSERQARDYVKELERSGFIVVEQRGLRKTNAYLFVWTAELDRLTNAVPESGEDPDDPENDSSSRPDPDRNDCSGQDRKHGSAPDRNSCSAQDRKSRSGPIGINSPGIGSLESSSSSTECVDNELRKTMTTSQSSAVACQQADAIVEWAKSRRVQRLRTDRRIGGPDGEQVQQWSRILEAAGISERESIYDLMDTARQSADRAGEWRNWSFLTLQVQLAAERRPVSVTEPQPEPEWNLNEEDPASEWALAKSKIRGEIGEIPFSNWFTRTRQLEREGSRIKISVSDEPSRFFLESEYGEVTRRVLAELGVDEVRWILEEPVLSGGERVQQPAAQTALGGIR